MTYSETRDLIIKLAEVVDGKVKSSYSGRGMFGKTCYAIVTHMDPDEVLQEAGALGLTSKVAHAKVDNMGHDYVIYWPGVTGNVIPGIVT